MLFTMLLFLPQADPVSASSYRIVQTRTGKDITLAQLADELAAGDVAFFGELHDNVVGHQVYAELARALAERRPDLVISMEMFERDTQGVVNDYLRGRIDEQSFLKHSRPWKDYARDYRPLIELARKHNLDVIAGNLPRTTAAKVAGKDGITSPFFPRSTTAPADRYRELFMDAMKGHPGVEGAAEKMYQAQCAKDDAMAEAIADYLNSHPHRQPLVIHCNGNFHSDYGLGTASRLVQRVPLAQLGIISMVAADDVANADIADHRRKAHYLLIVPTPPKPASKSPAAEKEKTKEKQQDS